MKELLSCVRVVVKTLNFCKFHAVIWQISSKNCTEVRAARAARLFFLIQPIRSLFSGNGNEDFRYLHIYAGKKQ